MALWSWSYLPSYTCVEGSPRAVGLKFDFKEPAIVRPTIELLQSLRRSKGTRDNLPNQLAFDWNTIPIILNADILQGYGGRKPLFDPDSFLSSCALLPRATISIGWTTANPHPGHCIVPSAQEQRRGLACGSSRVGGDALSSCNVAHVSNNDDQDDGAGDDDDDDDDDGGGGGDNDGDSEYDDNNKLNASIPWSGCDSKMVEMERDLLYDVREMCVLVRRFATQRRQASSLNHQRRCDRETHSSEGGDGKDGDSDGDDSEEVSLPLQITFPVRVSFVQNSWGQLRRLLQCFSNENDTSTNPTSNSSSSSSSSTSEPGSCAGGGAGTRQAERRSPLACLSLTLWWNKGDCWSPSWLHSHLDLQRTFLDLGPIAE